MMYGLEFISICLAICLSILCARSDVGDGIIYNKVLGVFAFVAVLIDILYYSIYGTDLLFDFFANVIILSAVSLYLFYSHSFAGGDCKMLMVMALLYPARYYVPYGKSILTLVFVIGIAILAGYLYLLCYSIRAIVIKRVNFTFAYMKAWLLNFLKSYASAMVYMLLLNCLFIFCSKEGLFLNPWILRGACLLLAWCVGRYPVLKKSSLLIFGVIAVAGLSWMIGMVPISLNPGNYVLVIFLMFCQMTIRTTIYETVRIDQLQKGMILTTMSSLLMQTSITKGLPGVSTEDLKSRLTAEEIESIKIWAKATKMEELTIVRKIPFAIFISIGFLGYFILWRALVWV